MVSSHHAACEPEVPTDESLTIDLHQRLHWDAIRAVCREPGLPPETRRSKLRFLLAGLARGAEMSQTHRGES